MLTFTVINNDQNLLGVVNQVDNWHLHLKVLVSFPLIIMFILRRNFVHPLNKLLSKVVPNILKIVYVFIIY